MIGHSNPRLILDCRIHERNGRNTTFIPPFKEIGRSTEISTCKDITEDIKILSTCCVSLYKVRGTLKMYRHVTECKQHSSFQGFGMKRYQATRVCTCFLSHVPYKYPHILRAPSALDRVRLNGLFSKYSSTAAE